MGVRQNIGSALMKLIAAMFGLNAEPEAMIKKNSALQGYVEAYRSAGKEINFTKTAANKIANIVSFDSKLSIEGDNERARYLDGLIKPYFNYELQKLAARIAGTGGVILKPYTLSNNIYIDVLYQPQLIGYELRGDKMSKAVFEAELFEVKHDIYRRIETHTLNADRTYIIEQTAYKNDKVIPLETVAKWAEFERRQDLAKIDNMLFSIIINTTDSGEEFNNVFGVPLTYGQDTLAGDILKLFEALNKEFTLKKPRLGIDSRVMKTGKRGTEFPDEQIAELYIKFDGDMENAFAVYSPQYQEESIINAVEYLYNQLENGIGVSQGIFTKLKTVNATATEIKQAMFETLCLVGNIRKKIEQGCNDIAYACDAIADANKITPKGEYSITADWDYSLFESSTEKWKQYMDGQAAGAVRPEELRMYLFDEDKETAINNLPEQIPEGQIVGE